MKTTEHNGTVERNVLIGMIVDATVAGRAASRWKDRPFASKVSNLVGKWAVDHFLKYGKPIGKGIELKLARWSERNGNREAAEEVSRFLAGLSTQWQAFEEGQGLNPEHLVDEMADLWDQVALRRTAQDILAAVESADAEKAREVWGRFNQTEMGMGSRISLLNDPETLKGAFAERERPLIEYHGALGRFFGNAFHRGAFIGFLAGEKATKSYWLLEIAWAAMLQRLKVAYLQVGDMTVNDVMLRAAVRAAMKPLYSRDGRWPMTLRYPIKIRPPLTLDEDDMARVEYEAKVFPSAVTCEEAWQAFREVSKTKIKSSRSYFELSVHPNWSMSVDKIRTLLMEWKRDGYEPDLLVVDYADLLHPPKGSERLSEREQHNRTWMALRGLSQELNLLTVSATQANRESAKAHKLTRLHIGEDKRKLAHCTTCFGLAMGPREKEAGISRLNYIGGRGWGWSGDRFCYTVGCLSFSRPFMKACLFERSEGDEASQEVE